MKATIAFVLCCAVGSAVGYYVQREQPYNVGPDDPYSVAVDQGYLQVPSQRLFWSNQGSNQVGGTGWWSMLTNKFPILSTMFGRMEVPPQQYGTPQFGTPQFNVPSYQPQFYAYPQQYYPQSWQNFVPSPGRDVGFTDDAVIVTPPQVPIAPQPAPQPSPEPAPGYHYNRPQYRLELPHK